MGGSGGILTQIHKLTHLQWDSSIVKWWYSNASLGKAPVYGGGCGAFGGNPDGCPAHKDTKPPGSWYYFYGSNNIGVY